MVWKMKKIEYYVKKYFIALFEDNAEGLNSAMDELKKIALIENKEKEISSEFEKVNTELIQLRNEDHAEEKMKNLIESYREAVEHEGLSPDEYGKERKNMEEARNKMIFDMEFLGSSKGWFDYYRDVVTDVMYVNKTGVGALTVMLDPTSDGPLTYSRYCMLKNRK